MLNSLLEQGIISEFLKLLKHNNRESENGVMPFGLSIEMSIDRSAS